MPPGYAPDPGQERRQQAHAWYGQDGFPHGEAPGPGGQPYAGGQPYPGAQGAAGPGPAGYAAPGYSGPSAFPGQAGFPPGHGYPGPAGHPGGPGGQHPFPGPGGYPAGGGFAGPGEAPYAEYQAWRPHGAPGGYPGPDGYGEIVNGGDYASVIHEDDFGGPQSRPRMQRRGQGLGEWSPDTRAGTSAGPGQPAGGAVRGRAITAGGVDAGWSARAAGPAKTADSGGRSATSAPVTPASPASASPPVPPASAAPATEAAPAEATVANPVTTGTPADAKPRPAAAPAIDPALAYGPDDPAYGPPGPDWYKRDEERAPHAEDGEPPADAAESRAARGPFEPLRAGDREEAARGDYQPDDLDVAPDEPDASSLDSDIADYEPIDYEMSELLGLDAPDDPEAGALGRLTDMYQAAETVSPASLDRHFDQLLERQRQLISDYFSESTGLGLAEAVTPATSAATAATDTPADSPVPLGFDTAESLASLRGELRGAQ
jgi:hypothetical protein